MGEATVFTTSRRDILAGVLALPVSATLLRATRLARDLF